MNSQQEKITAPSRVVAKLSDPALRWVASLYDPRTCGEEPSVPHGTALSQKIKVFSRGSFSTGTTGFGFVTVAPFIGVANDSSPVTTSISTSVMAAGTALSAVAAVANANTNSNFASAQVGTTVGKVTYKLVGGALYVKYAGTELTRGGDMILIEEPNHGTLFTYSYNTALGFDYAKRVNVSNEWQHVAYTPNSDSECEFGGSLSAAYAFPFLGVIVNSAAQAGQTFDYEFFGWYEVVGSLARGATISFSDTVGYNAVVGAANQFQQLDSVLGADGFLHACATQLDNMSGIARNATHVQNWAGLAAFLPQIASVATRAARALSTEFLGPSKVQGTPKLVAPLPRVIPARVPRPKSAIKRVLKKVK